MNEESSGDSWERTHAVVAAAMVAVFIALVAFASTGVRGSDQYWYVADVETITRGLPHASNDVFPVVLLAGGGAPFVHDSLPMYLCVPAALLFGPFLGWVVTNTLATVVAAGVIGFIVWRLARSASSSVLAAAAYLFLPITVWQTTQPLVEAIIAMFVAVALAIVACTERRRASLVALAVTLGLAYWCRVSFSPLLAGVPLLALAQRERSVAERGASALLTGAIVAAFFVARPLLFHEAMPSSIQSVLANQLATGSNMDFLLALEAPSPTPAAVLRKVMVAWRTQLGGASSAQLFYLPFNALASYSIVQAVRRGTAPGPRTLAWSGLLLIALHIVTISLHQNQFRYLLVPLAALISGFFVGQASWFAARGRPLAIATGLAAVALAVDASLVWRLHQEGTQDRTESSRLAAALHAHVAGNEAVVLCTSTGVTQMFAYAARPNAVLEVFETYPHDLYPDLARRIDARWLACPPESPVVAAFGLQGRAAEVEALPAPYANFGLYRLGPEAPAR